MFKSMIYFAGRRVIPWLMAVFFFLGFIIPCNALSTISAIPQVLSNKVTEPDTATRARIVKSYGRLSLSFEANHGQTDSKVKFLSRGSGYNLFLTSTEAVLSLRKAQPRDKAAQGSALHKADKPEPATVVAMKLVGANPDPRITGANQLPGKLNYFLGKDPKKWHPNIPTYARVRYSNVYPGIDLVFYGQGQKLEYDFIVAPGADPRAIALCFGQTPLKIDQNGDLALNAKGELRLKKPFIYQDIDGIRKPVSGGYVLYPVKNEKHTHRVGFKVAAYDRTRPLVIDPVLVFSTYLGGSSNDHGYAIAVDATGNCYVTGSTYSTDFPTQDPLFPSYSGINTDAFVTCLTPSGNALVYSTYLGSGSSDYGYGIAVGASGNCYVTGITCSGNFPTQDPLFPSYSGNCDTFVTCLSPAGDALVYSTYLGGTNYDKGLGIALDASGNCYVTGETWSTDFPTQDPLFPSHSGGDSDAFVTCLNQAGDALVYSTYLGGSAEDLGGAGIAVDASGNCYVTGNTWSTDFPTQDPLFPSHSGGNLDAFVTCLNQAGDALVYSTYLGGSAEDRGAGIAVDASGNCYVTGHTGSTDFPTQDPLFPSHSGGHDAFVTCLNQAGDALVYSTYLGGSSNDYGYCRRNSDHAYGIVLDASGNCYVSGSTGSTDFPTQDPLFPSNSGGYDAFVTCLNQAGDALVYSTYLGGSSNDFGYCIAVNATGSCYVTGSTESTDFPMQDPLYPNYAGSKDAFVSKISSPYISLSGTVSLNGLSLGGVTIILSGAASSSTSTATDGIYVFPNLPDGSYTVTPTLAGYTFNPVSIEVTISGESISGLDFRACNISIPLSGILRDAITKLPLSGVTVTVDGTYSDITDQDGYYEISGLSCGEHVVTVEVPSGFFAYSHTIDTSQTPTLEINLTKPETVYGPDTPSGYSVDPVNTATGNYIYQKEDLRIPGRGLPFVFKRYYNSQDSVDGPLGYGWGHKFDVALTVNGDSSVSIKWGDGKTQTWTADGSDGFTPQYGVSSTLTDNGEGVYTLTRKDSINYAFDSSGRLSNITDKNGNAIVLTYTASLLTQITDTVGRHIDLTYDANNRITTITDAIGRTIRYAYDSNGDMISSTDMNGNQTIYTYDDKHQMLMAVDPRGNTVVTNVYDDQKRVVTSQSDAKGGQTIYIYNDVDNITNITDPLGNTYYHYHDELLRLIQAKDSLGNSIHYTYDEAGNRTSIKDKNGNITTFTYDEKGNVLTRTDALSNTSSITYNANNNPLTKTDALKKVTTFEYDGSGNLLKTTDPAGNSVNITCNAHGQPLTITDALGNTITNTYDAEGNLVEITDALGNKTVHTYDGVGRVLTTKDALNHMTAYTYDNNNNLLSMTDPLEKVTAYTYDSNGNRLTVTDPKGNKTTSVYDEKDLLLTQTDPLGNSQGFTYDLLDRITSVTDKNGNITTFVYNQIGNLVKIIDAAGNSSFFTYDANGNMLTKKDALGRVHRYTYDALNRVVSTIDPLNNVAVTSYDSLGRVDSETNSKGQKSTFEYDSLGRMTKATDPDGGTVLYTYDGNGNRLTMIDTNGRTNSYSYDAMNRLTSTTDPLANVYQYAYDAVGNLIQAQQPDSDIKGYNYDSNNRLNAITYSDSTTVHFTYDVNGNRIQMTDSNGTTTYSYDALNRLTSYTDVFGNTVSYTLDSNGNIASITYPDVKAVTYTYDSLNHMLTVTDWLSNTTTYTYDAAGELIKTQYPNNTSTAYGYDTGGRLKSLENMKSDSTIIASYKYTIDAIGNHTKAIIDQPLIPVIAVRNLTYAYDADNRLTDIGGTASVYDVKGNLTGKGTDSFSYDHEDRLIQSNIAGANTQYVYDGLGNRLAKTWAGSTTRYVLDISQGLTKVLAETDGNGAITAYYVYGKGLISKLLPDGTFRFYHYDSRGSTVALTDAGQNITDAYSYDTFGREIDSTGPAYNPFRYLGRYGVIKDETAFNYIRARYYDPETGRFITKDPLTGKDGDSQSLNRYVYALNNPVILVDVSGLCAENSDTEKKEEFLDFMMRFTSELAEMAQNLSQDEFGDAFVTLLNNQHMQVTVDLNQVDYLFSQLNLIKDYVTFADNWDESMVRAESGEIDSLEDYFGEVTALSFNSAKDLAAGTVIFFTLPLTWVSSDFKESAETFEQVMAFDVDKDMVIEGSQKLSEATSKAYSEVSHGWRNAWDNVKWAFTTEEP